MAVDTTPQDILEQAYSKSKGFAPGTIATESTELLDLVGRSLRALFQVGARVNPLVFATSTTQAGAGGAWVWPDDVEAFLRIEDDANNSEIVAVPFDDRGAEEGLAAIYYLGRSFYPAGNANDPDPATDTLLYWYSKRPEIPATLSTPLDESWPESFNELLALDVALYLALKMEKGELATAFKQQRDSWLQQFIRWCEHVVPFERRRRGHLRVINTNTLVPLSQLMVGGSSVEVG